VRADPLEHG